MDEFIRRNAPFVGTGLFAAILVILALVSERCGSP